MDEEQQIAPPPTDPVEKLYNAVHDNGLYTKSLEEFKDKYSTPEAQQKLYSVVKEHGLYTKSADEFTGKYFGTAPQKADAAASAPYRPDLGIRNPSESTQGPKISLQKPPNTTNADQFPIEKQKAADTLKALTDKHADQAIDHLNANDMRDRMTQIQNAAQSGAMTPEAADKAQQQLMAETFNFSQRKDQVKSSLPDNPVLQKKIENTIAGIHPELAPAIQKAQYLEAGDDQNQNKKLANAKAIEKGELTFQHGQLYRPLGTLESIAEAVKQNKQAIDAHDKEVTQSDTQNMNALLNKRLSYNPDDPINLPSGVGNLIGGQIPITIKGGAIAAVTSLLPESKVLAPMFSALGVAADMAKATHHNSLEQHFNSNMDKGMSAEEAYKDAKDKAGFDSMADYMQGLVMGGAGAHVGMGELNLEKLTPGFKNIAKTLANNTGRILEHGTPESIVSGLTSGGAQVAKNVQEGKDYSEGVPEALLIGAALPHMIGIAARGAGGLVDPKTYSTVMSGLGKIPDVGAKVDEIVASGHMTPQAGVEVKKNIQDNAKIDDQIPPNITDEDTRLKLKDALTQRDELVAQEAKTHPALKADVKSQISEVDKSIKEMLKPAEEPKPTEGQAAPTGKPEAITPRSPEEVSKMLKQELPNKYQKVTLKNEATGEEDEMSASLAQKKTAKKVDILNKLIDCIGA
ncbi:MAG TPA: hypothetical protein VGZ90_13340 [Puia sp.]|jgi:hypothetical protein|nr:hypothetical protein [Puia sp.]